MNPIASLPLLGPVPLESPLALHRGAPVSRRRYLADARLLAERLPDATHALLNCSNRYNFMVAFAAVLSRSQTALLPPGQAPELLSALCERFSAYRIEDADIQTHAAEAKGAAGHDAVPSIPAGHAAAILFTSGSTGAPRAQVKTWGELHGVTLRAMERFALDGEAHNIVATVPAQHSYGFESSVLYTLLGPGTVHSGHPLYPADVCAALHAIPAPRILVTTPLHLDVCLRAGLDWPAMNGIVSATAPLEPALATAAENHLGAPLYEIYGCSEAGALASRRTARETSWMPYSGVQLEKRGADWLAQAPYLDGPRPLSDRLSIEDDGRFMLLGRSSDQIKLAGKRTSLGELNHHLLSIEGVEEGSFVAADSDNGRLAAVVVAPGLSAGEVRRRLARLIDPVFLPRPLVQVAHLERTGTGKLQREYLMELVAQHAASAGSGQA